MPLTTRMYWAEHAWIDSAVRPAVLITTSASGRITEVAPHTRQPPPGAVTLNGLTLPGLANTHSHAFHRGLRGMVQPGTATGRGSGADTDAPAVPDSFWSWRELMYGLAARLTPESYFALARAAYAEMALAGITAVGEFHYLHHGPDGARYDDPNAMGQALIDAAGEAGIRITLLDTCYLTAGFGTGPGPVQRRFSDGSAANWAARAARLTGSATSRIGAAIHSVRAVPAGELATVAAWAAERAAPLHLHLSEQPAENEDCRAAHGRTPTQLLADHGVLGPHTTAVHATHLTPEDIALLGDTGTGVCLCPTTERDLADGIGPATELRDAGSPLSLGSDSHAVIDLLGEARAMELDQRLRTGRRGHWSTARLLDAASAQGHAALGWTDAGRLRPGALADFTTVALDTVRTAGPSPRHAAEAAVYAATAADIQHTIVDGRHIVRDGQHQLVPRTAHDLAGSISALRG